MTLAAGVALHFAVARKLGEASRREALATRRNRKLMYVWRRPITGVYHLKAFSY